MLGDVLVISWFHKVLEETAVGYSDALYLLGIPHRLERCATRELTGSNHIYVIIGVHHYKRLPRHFICVQTEQAGSTWITPQFKAKLQRALAVWDFSKTHCRQWTCKRACFIPMRVPLSTFFDRSDNSADAKLKPPKLKPIKDIDICFFGGPHERRFKMKRIFEQMGKSLGFNVCFLVVGESEFIYEAQRDALVDRAKLVLNIHFWSSASLETHRLSYLMSRGACVLSEPSCDSVLDAMYAESVQFARYDALPQVALKILGDDRLRARMESKAYELNFRHQFD
ncbi:unnamed protein product, partial [Phaeothamnion confervicola]